MADKNKYIMKEEVKQSSYVVKDRTTGKAFAIMSDGSHARDYGKSLIGSDSEVVEVFVGIEDLIEAHNVHNDLVQMLNKGEDIISGIEAQADNNGIDLSEARHWWVDARKLLDEIEDQQNAVD